MANDDNTISSGRGAPIEVRDPGQTNVPHSRGITSRQPPRHLGNQRRAAMVDGPFSDLPTRDSQTPRSGFAYASSSSAVPGIAPVVHGQRASNASLYENDPVSPIDDGDRPSSRLSFRSNDDYGYGWSHGGGDLRGGGYRDPGRPLFGGEAGPQARDRDFGGGMDMRSASVASDDIYGDRDANGDRDRDRDVSPHAPDFPWAAGRLPSDEVLAAHVRRAKNAEPGFARATEQRQHEIVDLEVAELRRQHRAGQARAEGEPPRPWERGYEPDRDELEAHALHGVIERRSPADVRAFHELPIDEQQRQIDHEVGRVQQARARVHGGADPGGTAPLDLSYPWEPGRRPSDQQLEHWVRHVAIPGQDGATRARFAQLPRHEQDAIVADMTRQLSNDRDKLWNQYQMQQSQRMAQQGQALLQLDSAWISFQTGLVSALANVMKSIGHAIENASRRG